MTYILDACAMIAFLNHEPGWEKKVDVNAIIAELTEARRRIAELEAKPCVP